MYYITVELEENQLYHYNNSRSGSGSTCVSRVHQQQQQHCKGSCSFVTGTRSLDNIYQAFGEEEEGEEEEGEEEGLRGESGSEGKKQQVKRKKKQKRQLQGGEEEEERKKSGSVRAAVSAVTSPVYSRRSVEVQRRSKEEGDHRGPVDLGLVHRWEHICAYSDSTGGGRGEGKGGGVARDCSFRLGGGSGRVGGGSGSLSGSFHQIKAGSVGSGVGCGGSSAGSSLAGSIVIDPVVGGGGGGGRGGAVTPLTYEIRRKAQGTRQFGVIRIEELNLKQLREEQGLARACERYRARTREEAERKSQSESVQLGMNSDSSKGCWKTVEGPNNAQRWGRGEKEEEKEDGGGSSGEFEEYQLEVVAGNPSVDVTKGILHIYRERTLAELEGQHTGAVSSSAGGVHGVGRRDGEEEGKEDGGEEQGESVGNNTSLLLCILFVPEAMDFGDLLRFLGPLQFSIDYIRIIRPENTSHGYTILLCMESLEAADQFYTEYNGKRFNSLEPEICHVGYVKHVEAVPSSELATFIPNSIAELPACPVCLERMDEAVSGVLTILCNHSFHCECLYKWKDSRCPVCRYCKRMEDEDRYLLGRNVCSEAGCDSQDNLWMCLICGNIGCSRYTDGHAFRHFLDTQHTYVMELETQRVWDYAGDNYVHRLIQNNTDGKMIEFPGRNEHAGRRSYGAGDMADSRGYEQSGSRTGDDSDALYTEGNCSFNEEKVDAIELEYTYLLTSQLESQREYFQDKISRIEKEAITRISETEMKLLEMQRQFEEMQMRLGPLEKAKKAAEKKNRDILQKYEKTLNNYQEEKEMNANLSENQKLWQKKCIEIKRELNESEKQKKEAVAGLEEQVRDLMFFLEARDKIEAAPEDVRADIRDGSVSVAEGNSSGGGNGGGSGKRAAGKKKKK
eukprot:Nk52_evm5s2391 gene=Nk52_evmTU5s2391